MASSITNILETAGLRIPLKGAANTRDLGGYPVKGGKKVKPCRLIRSGMLNNLTQDDKDILCKKHNLKRIIDFRTDAEVQSAPDPAIAGVSHTRVPMLEYDIPGISSGGGSMESQFGDFMKQDMVGFLTGIFPQLVRSPYSQSQWRVFFDALLAAEDGATLYHCTGGKDRVGTGTALLLSALGAERELIIADFLKTNTLLKETIAHTMKAMENKVPDPAIRETIGRLMGVEEAFILAVFDTLDNEFGGVEKYLQNQLQLSPEKLESLRNLYLD